MRHQKAGKKLNRTGSHRDAMFRNMVTSLFAHGRIRTTDTKAKELRRWADHMITLARRGDLHARRQAMAIMRDKAVVHKLFEDVSERFGDRAGGYTRAIKVGRRRGDAAPISLVEFVAAREKKKGKKKKIKASTKGVVKGKKEVPPKIKTKKTAEKAKIAADKAPEEAAAKPEDSATKEESVAVSEPKGEEGSQESEVSSEDTKVQTDAQEDKDKA
jgi:large subunit ribosomal protein L17